MGNSTITLSSMYDSVASRGIPDPRMGPSGYGDKLAIEIATAVMADLICDRFNWKWNSAVAAAFYTNSWQQDYPQPAQAAGLIGWGEDCAMIDINNTALPKPLRNCKWRRGLSRTSISGYIPENLCWMYNGDLTLGNWPGPGVVYAPLVGKGLATQNPIMSMLDANGNILIVSSFGTTAVNATLEIATITRFTDGENCMMTLTYSGPSIEFDAGVETTFEGLTAQPALNGQTYNLASSTGNSLTFLTGDRDCVVLDTTAETGTMDVAAGVPPLLPAESAEGTTVLDGTVVWMCVSAASQGFRIDRLPSATGVVQQIVPVYQLEPPRFATMAQTLNPVPDSYARYFRRGLEAECLSASVNPGDMKRGEQMKADWINAMTQSKKQGDRELNVYGLFPAGSVVEQNWGDFGPYTADRPF